MKATKEHRVPLLMLLCRSVKGFYHALKVSILYSLPPEGTTPRIPALLAVLKGMGYTDLTQHGFRSTFRDWAGNDQLPKACEVKLNMR